MKTLADLKRNAHLYKWKLMYNSWFPNDTSLAYFRKVAIKDTTGIGLETISNDEKIKLSYLNWPKAKELSIKPNDEGYELSIVHDNPIPGNKNPHTMIYILQAI